MSEDTHYPTVREALFGNGHAANAWCAIKYTFWHMAYLLLTVMGGFLFVGFKFAEFVDSRIDAGGITTKVVTHKYVKLAGRLFIYGFLGVGVAFMLYFAYKNPILFLATSGGFVWAAILWFVGEKEIYPRVNPYLESISGYLNRFGQTTKQKPVTRRVYGYCPVDFDIEPKWFDRLTSWVEK